MWEATPITNPQCLCWAGGEADDGVTLDQIALQAASDSGGDSGADSDYDMAGGGDEGDDDDDDDDDDGEAPAFDLKLFPSIFQVRAYVRREWRFEHAA